MSEAPLRLCGVFMSRNDIGSSLDRAGDVALVERGHPRLLVVKCPCGCGEEYVINLDQGAGKAWRLYRRAGKLSLFPSVWRDVGCRSHFILWRDRFYLFDRRYEAEDELPDLGTRSLDIAILNTASTVTYRTVQELADALDEIPWEVLLSCRRLARLGLLKEGQGDLVGSFRRSPEDDSV